MRSILLLFTSMVVCVFFGLSPLYSQICDSEEFLGRFQKIDQVVPDFYPTRSVLTENEMHVLDTLTNAERQIIEESYDPPAVGVIRDFVYPVEFNLSETGIPEQGEILVPGGRLTRVSEELLVYTAYFRSKKADAIRLFFAEGSFPHPVKVNIFSRDDYAFNQMELRGTLDEYGFYTTSTFADYLTLQVVIPVLETNENVSFKISKIIHVDNRYILEENWRSCYLDANCADANSFAHIDGFRRATARLYFQT